MLTGPKNPGVDDISILHGNSQEHHSGDPLKHVQTHLWFPMGNLMGKCVVIFEWYKYCVLNRQPTLLPPFPLAGGMEWVGTHTVSICWDQYSSL